MKALHNLHRSSQFMEKFLDVSPGHENLAGEALFHSAVINYAKPFINTETKSSKKKFGDKEFRGHPGFDIKLHDHPLKLRNTVIAHEGLKEIEPNFVWIQTQTGSPENFKSVPFQACLRNNFLAFPTDPESASKIQMHVKATLSRVVILLINESPDCER